MNLTTFLATIHDPSSARKPILCFTGREYPPLFFSWLFGHMQPVMQQPWESFDAATVSMSHLFSKLQMSMLGSTSWYWLGDIGEFSAKDGKQLALSLASYQGPHTVYFFTEKVPTGFNEEVTVVLPDAVDKKLFLALLALEQPDQKASDLAAKNAPIIKALFDHETTLSLDRACSIVRYIRVLGSNQPEFIRTVLAQLVPSQTSLFTLSQYFFAKQPTPFFSEWIACASDYGEPFWVTFWSEQIWRTHSYIRLMQQQKISDAKTIAYRLPFSVLQRDWKKLSLGELQRAHAFLYTLDHAIKNGSAAYGIDLFYAKFLAGEFQSVARTTYFFIEWA
jgi:hypothetical protein